jgi:hypothetical protein
MEGNSPIEPDSPGSVPNQPSSMTSGPDRDTGRDRIANNLLIAGSALVILGVLIFIYSSWSNLSVWQRIATAWLPVLILHSLGFATLKKAGFRSLAENTVLTASFLLPFVIGYSLVQSGEFSWYGATDRALVIFLSSMLALVWYLIMEFALRLRQHAVLTVTAAAVMACSFATLLGKPDYVRSILGIILGYLFLSAAWIITRSPDPEDRWEGLVYSTAGGLAGVSGLLTLPLTAGTALLDKGLLSQDTVNPAIILGYVAVSFLFLGIAIMYSLDWESRRTPVSLYLRQVSEWSAAGTLTLPAIYSLLNNSLPQLLDILILLVCGILSLALSNFIRVSGYRYFGVAASVLGIVYFFTEFLARIDLAPVLLTIGLGLLLILTAFTLNHLPYRQMWDRLWQHPSHSLYGLGINPPRPHPEREQQESANPWLPEPGPLERRPSGHPTDQGREWRQLGAVLILTFLLITIINMLGQQPY